jgi:hypothetical protein
LRDETQQYPSGSTQPTRNQEFSFRRYFVIFGTALFSGIENTGSMGQVLLHQVKFSQVLRKLFISKIKQIATELEGYYKSGGKRFQLKSA